jgi:membrane-bound serine protease (ClpP class)
MTVFPRSIFWMCLFLVSGGLSAWGEGEPHAPQAPPIPGGQEIQKVVEEWEKAVDKVTSQVGSLVQNATRTLEQNLTDPPSSPSHKSEPAAGSTISKRSHPLVYVLPIEGQVRSIMMTILRRGLLEASKEGASLFLLEMDTPGGELAIAEEMSRTLLAAKVPTATWIKNEGLSAGMLIAISTQKIYMARLALIGDCQPIFMGTGEIKEAPEKVLTVVRQYGIRAASKNGYPVDAVLAMIDADQNYKSADGTIHDTTGKLLTLNADQAVQIKFASALAESLDEVLQETKLAGSETRRFEMNWAETLAAFITNPAIASILTLLGLAALFIEYKTPGFGFFGGVGLVLLSLVFWGHAIAHLAGYEGAILFLGGIVLLAVEIFIIPGHGVFGTAGVILMLVGILLTLLKVPFDDPLFIPEVHLMGPLVQTILIFMGSIVLILVALKYLPESHTMERVGMSLAMRLEASEGYTAHDNLSQNRLLGKTGKTASQLRPGGIAVIEGRRVDVVTEGDFIDSGKKVHVTRVEGMRVIVIPEKEAT